MTKLKKPHASLICLSAFLLIAGCAHKAPNVEEALAELEMPPAEQIVRADGTVEEVDLDESTIVSREPAEVFGYSESISTSTKPAKKPTARKGVGQRQKNKSYKSKPYPGAGKGGASSAPIWSSFYANFKKCAPGCEPANYGTWGSRGNRSCHPSGQAVDVGALNCGGKIHKAINRGKFDEFVRCMRGKMKTLYRNGKHVTKGHHDHAHFSNGCIVNGKRWY